MNLLPNIFLENVSKQIFPGNAPPEIQYQTFKHRFHCDNYSLKNIEIGKILSDTLGGDCESGINQFIKEAIKKIERAFRDELVQDEITQEMLGLSDKKRKHGRIASGIESPWQVAYKWLWKVKYIRWQQEYIWDEWKKRATTNSEWIQFNIQPENPSRGIKPTWEDLAPKNLLPINTRLNWTIQIDTLGSYLILFNRGLDDKDRISRHLVIPSQAFAPEYRLSEQINLMPQERAMCENIEFDAVGKEEYLGIVIDEALDLPWLTPDSDNLCPEWQGQHLGELWELLQGKDNWRVVYRNFDVVAQNAQID